MKTVATNKELQSASFRILLLKDYILALQKKLVYLRINYGKKNDIEKNEVAIEEYNVYMELHKAKKKLIYMQRIFESQILNPYLADVNFVEKEYDGLLKKAKELQERSFELKHLLYAVNWKVVSDSIDNKISLCKELQQKVIKVE